MRRSVLFFFTFVFAAGCNQEIDAGSDSVDQRPTASTLSNGPGPPATRLAESGTEHREDLAMSLNPEVVSEWAAKSAATQTSALYCASSPYLCAETERPGTKH
jgi:hypothetical protein